MPRRNFQKIDTFRWMRNIDENQRIGLNTLIRKLGNNSDPDFDFSVYA